MSGRIVFSVSAPEPRRRRAARSLCLGVVLALVAGVLFGAGLALAQTGSTRLTIRLPDTLILETGTTAPGLLTAPGASVDLGVEPRVLGGSPGPPEAQVRLRWLGAPGCVQVSRPAAGLVRIESL